MDRRMYQQEVGELIGVSESAIWNWESGWTSEPSIRSMPAIIEFLGYVPVEAPTTVREQLQAYRMIRGCSQREAARQIVVDTTTWFRWECRKTRPRIRRAKKKLEAHVALVMDNAVFYKRDNPEYEG